jgi:hypothetical protein
MWTVPVKVERRWHRMCLTTVEHKADTRLKARSKSGRISGVELSDYANISRNNIGLYHFIGLRDGLQYLLLESMAAAWTAF